MARRTTYHAGGAAAGGPAGNRAEEWDSVAGTFTAWDSAGLQVASRALSADEVALLAAEVAGEAAAVNGRTVEDRLRAALAVNRAFLALASPTAADRNAQVVALTRQVSALVRYALRDLSDASDV